ncbi:MAG: DUF1707 SHOCT-like domain-containing protein [Propionibacteriaceae bacterium]
MTQSYPSASEPTSDRGTEPRDVGPVAGGNLRASDADRDQVIQVLSTAYADGRLTREEHDERLEAVMAAKTFDDLVPLTRDLVFTGARYPQQATTPPAGQEVAPTNGRRWQIQPGGTDEADTMVAVFSGVSRKGKWRMRRRTQSFAMFGGIDLDLNEAVFEGPVVEINGAWIFGGLDIKVPEGMEIRDQTMGIFGGTDVKHVGEPQPGAPTLVIKGFTLFGGVSVSGPKPKRRRGWH